MSGTEKKSRKKKRMPEFIRLVLAALIFAIISAAVFQVYNYLNPQKEVEINIKTAPEDKEDLSLVSLEDKDTEDRQIPSVEDGIITDVSNVVNNVMPSIVAINASGTDTTTDFWGRKFSRPFQGSGSGIIIGQSEEHILVVTNNHVIAGAEQVELRFVDDSTAMASVKGADVRTDLAVLQVAMRDLSAKTLNEIKVAVLGDSNALDLGEMVFAIGNALGYGQSVTVGYVSAKDRQVEVDSIMMKLIQTDAAINPGNSGGALINSYGEVIGINTLKNIGDKIEGMGYAIPITEAIPMIEMLMNKVAVTDVDQMGFLGINLGSAKNVTKEFAERFNMPSGIYINDIVDGSPVDEAGLRKGNIIVGANGIAVETIEDLLNILTYTKPGDKMILEVKVQENDKYVKQEIEVILGKRPN